MVYIYYMKIRNLLFAFFFLFPLVAGAQVTVVRVDKNTVYLDTSSLSHTVQKNDIFKVILSSEKLVNPKTGKDLGPLYTYSAEGKITEVQPLYAVGTLPSGTGVRVGQEAVLEKSAPAQPTAQTAAAPVQNTTKHRVHTYAPVEQEIVGLSTANITAPGADDLITLSDKGQITVWKRNGETLKEMLSYQLPVGKKPLAVSAVPVRGKNTAEIFATVYDTTQARISTFILAYEKGQWVLLDTLPYFVKEMGCAPQKTIWMQKPFVLETRPGNATNLVYEDGRFQAGTHTLNTQHNWLTGTLSAPVENNETDNFLYTATGGKIRMSLANGKSAESKNLFASSPNRVKYKQEIVKFFPALQVVPFEGGNAVVAVENKAKYGLLSSTFGMYESGKIHFLSLQKGRLNLTDSVELDGFIYDTACTGHTVLTAEVLSAGQSAVVEIFE